jgi:hypothetical protein
MVISEYVGINEWANRTATVSYSREEYTVSLFENGVWLRDVDTSMHSLSYAEDVAENWTIGVIKE